MHKCMLAFPLCFGSRQPWACFDWLCLNTYYHMLSSDILLSAEVHSPQGMTICTKLKKVVFDDDNRGASASSCH